MINAKINVSLIDKAKLFKGKKGTYLNVVLIETPNSPFSDYMIKQDQTEQERADNPDTPILGDAKIYKPKDQAPDTSADDDGVPF